MLGRCDKTDYFSSYAKVATVDKNPDKYLIFYSVPNLIFYADSSTKNDKKSRFSQLCQNETSSVILPTVNVKLGGVCSKMNRF